MGIAYMALLFIVIGAVFDFFDGMVARLLHVSSPIGKELDSLADDITFGFAPSAIVFSYLSTFHIHWPVIPFLAFIMAAFSALRLAKFNLDERQALGFIGLPTPANALFWGSLIVGLGDTISTIPYAEWLILGGTFISCYLLIAEIPMFALKFKTWGWKGNEIKYIFILSCIPLLLFLGVTRLVADGSGINENLCPLQRHQACCLRIPLVPAYHHTQFAHRGLNGVESQIAWGEVELLVVGRVIWDVHLTVDARDSAVFLQYHSCVMVQSWGAFLE